MRVGQIISGEKRYFVVKAVTSWIVFMWNYIGHKIIIFGGAGFLEE